jgi:hypothetical protein
VCFCIIDDGQKSRRAFSTGGGMPRSRSKKMNNTFNSEQTLPWNVTIMSVLIVKHRLLPRAPKMNSESNAGPRAWFPSNVISINEKVDEFLSPIEENQNVVDNFRDLASFVVARARYLLHDGRIHPHLVGLSDRGRFDPSDSRAANRLIAGAR